MNKRILLLDNYDSFTFNLFQVIRDVSNLDIEVRRNDRIHLEEVASFDAVVLSPGPGIPNEAGIMPELIDRYRSHLPILGICLGHQAIAESFGGKLENMNNVSHGLSVNTTVEPVGDALFGGLPKSFHSGRYHSWVVSDENLPVDLIVTSRDDAGRIMSLRHRELNVRGLQFHPESVLTPEGRTILKNWTEVI
jgi:anthranilate synthase component II